MVLVTAGAITSPEATAMEKMLLSGNEAVARGAFEAGVGVGTGYPGTPSTEILENLTLYPGVYTEWSVNEKVALEVAIGAALSGVRSLVTMKHVGLNVAADPLFTSSYIGVKAGLVVVSADDPSMHSSQNEQDNRNYAAAAKLPMLEPADSQEVKDYTVLSFELSERYDTPVVLRTTTRISHSKSVVIPAEAERPDPPHGFQRNIQKYVMIPSYARLRHEEVERRMRRIERDADTLGINRVEWGDKDVGFITAGVCYTYLRELFPSASVLKLGMVYPLPEKLIREFAAGVKKLYVVEELDPFLELRVRALGIPVEGKRFFPITGELTPDIIRKPFGRTGETKAGGRPLRTDLQLPPRPPQLCPGCPHRTVFQTLAKLGLTVTGDIGCYTLGALPPFAAIDTCVDMGASITIAQGIEIAGGAGRTVAVLGDSTFTHTGLAGLLNAAYNGRHSLIIILDNGTTAMTGMQPNPLSGERINGEPAVKLDYVKLAEAVGIDRERVRVVDAYKPSEISGAITGLIEERKLSLLVVQGLCMILKRRRQRKERSVSGKAGA
jgi:indolepyruvate ferredoxin oxidoreductase alpha subunit